MSKSLFIMTNLCQTLISKKFSQSFRMIYLDDQDVDQRERSVNSSIETKMAFEKENFLQKKNMKFKVSACCVIRSVQDYLFFNLFTFWTRLPVQVATQTSINSSSSNSNKGNTERAFPTTAVVTWFPKTCFCVYEYNKCGKGMKIWRS